VWVSHVHLSLDLDLRVNCHATKSGSVILTTQVYHSRSCSILYWYLIDDSLSYVKAKVPDSKVNDASPGIVLT